MAQAEFQNALNAHDRVRKSTDLPLFFGRKDKDVVSPHVLLDRINRAATVALWNTDDRKISEFYMILRDRALVWWDSLEDMENVDRTVWADVQREFLAGYAPKFTAKTTCTNFQDLLQRSGETVHDYYLRVTEALKKMCEAKPDAINTVRIAIGAAAADVAVQIKREGIKDAERFFMHQLFIAGLKEDIRMKIMEAGKATITESVTLAREIEVIHNDKKKGATIASVEDSNPYDDVDDDEINAINAIRFQKGKPPMNFNRRPGQPPQGQRGPQQQQRQQGQSSAFNGDCRYCKFKGHSQKDCRKRKAAKAPCVDAQGKPYANQTVNAVENSTAAPATAVATASSIAYADPYCLNW